MNFLKDIGLRLEQCPIYGADVSSYDLAMKNKNKSILIASITAVCVISFSNLGHCDDSLRNRTNHRPHGDHHSQTSNRDSSTGDRYIPTSNSSTAPERTSAAGSNTDSRNDRDQLSSRDREFITEAAQGGMAEVEHARTALNTSRNDGIQQFSRRLQEDHTRANDELRQLAANKGISVPTETSRDPRKMMEHLTKLSGNEFDKAYIDHMVKDHQEDIAKFEDAAKNAKDSDVRAFAEKQLPVLREHLDMARNLQSSAGNMKTSSNR